MTARVMLDLEADHANITRLLDLLDAEIERLAAGETADTDLMRDIMDYMTRYPDRVHHPKEDLVFARCRALDPEAAEWVDKLEHEHVDLERKGNAFLDLLVHVSDGAMVERDRLEATARDYSGFQRHHLRLENTTAFPAARALLSASDWQAIEAAYASSQDPVFGPVVHADFENLYAHIVPDT